MGEPVNHPDGAEGDNHGNNAAHPSLHGNRGETDMHADLPVSGEKKNWRKTTSQVITEHTCAWSPVHSRCEGWPNAQPLQWQMTVAWMSGYYQAFTVVLSLLEWGSIPLCHNLNPIIHLLSEAQLQILWGEWEPKITQKILTLKFDDELDCLLSGCGATSSAEAGLVSSNTSAMWSSSNHT